MTRPREAARRAELRSILLDALGEGSAALGQLLGIPLQLAAEGLEVLDTRAVADRPGTGIWLRIAGDMNGALLFFLAEDSWQGVVRCLAGETTATEPPDPLARSALMESGNLLVSAFLNRLHERLGINSLPQPPEFVRGDLRACLRQRPAPGQILIGVAIPWSAEPVQPGLSGALWLLAPALTCRTLLRRVAAFAG